jgi:uncharacterized protein YgbK (DUF1537 family)
MNRLLIIADDFTGALDTGVQFVKAGLCVKVCLWTQFDASILDDGCSVYSVDCESRHMSSDQASKRIRQVCQQAVALSFKYFYKKTDSTLRGNIGAEITACLETVQRSQPFIFIPSYPKANRMLKNGIMYVNNVRLDQTDYADDPLNPITEASASSLFRDNQNLQMSVLSEPCFVDTTSMEEHDQPDLYILDSDSDTQLRRIADYLAEIKWLKLTGGCAGFAEFLAEIIASQPGWARITSDAAAASPPGLLVICGSVNPRSLRQIDQFISAHPDHVRHTLTTEQKQQNFWRSDDAKVLIHRWHNILEQQLPVIVQTIDRHTSFDQTIDEQAVAVSLAQVVKLLVAENTRFSLVVFGGDTLFSIARELDFHFLRPLQEVTSGVVQSQVKTDTGTMMLYSKAGGLGHGQVLQEIDGVIRTADHSSKLQIERT